MENNYYKTEIDIISDFMSIFDVIPSGESRTVKAFIGKDGNLRSFSFNENYQITHDPKKAIDRQEIVIVPEHRRADTDEEYSIVFENEFKKSGACDREVFKKRHIEICQAKRDELTRFNNQALEYHIHTMDRYIKFLQQTSTSEGSKAVNTFPMYLDHPEQDAFAEKIKIEFTSVAGSGRDSAALYTALVKLRLMKYVENEKAIFQSMTDFFGFIGIYQGFNNYLNNDGNKQRSIIEDFKVRINKLIDKK